MVLGKLVCSNKFCCIQHVEGKGQDKDDVSKYELYMVVCTSHITRGQHHTQQGNMTMQQARQRTGRA